MNTWGNAWASAWGDSWGILANTGGGGSSSRAPAKIKRHGNPINFAPRFAGVSSMRVEYGIVAAMSAGTFGKSVVSSTANTSASANAHVSAQAFATSGAAVGISSRGSNRRQENERKAMLIAMMEAER